MRSRRFENVDKDRFWEVFWDGGELEVVIGRLGTKGRASRPHGVDARRYVEAEAVKRLAEGYVEVVPEAVAAQAAPRVAPDPALIARIAEAEDDDVPRRVYADWLLAQGDPLGELIALQCARAALPPWDPEHARLLEREEALVVVHRRHWVPAGLDVDFERGFITRARFVDQPEPAQLDALLAVAPLLRTIDLAPRSGGVVHDAAWRNISAPAWARITGVAFRGPRAPGFTLRAFAEQVATTRVDRLAMRSFLIDFKDIRVLVTRRAWRELDFHVSAIGPSSIDELVKGGARLEVLDLGSCGIEDAGTRRLVELPVLRRLSLRRSRASYASLAVLAGSPTLRALDLSAMRLTARDVEALGAAQLVELDLRETGIGDDAVEALANTPLATRLVRLDLGGNRLGDRATAALAAGRFPSLRMLAVRGLSAHTLEAGLPEARVTVR